MFRSRLFRAYRHGPPRGRPDRPARGRACRAAVMQRGDTGRRDGGAVLHRRPAQGVRVARKTERLARQGQAAAAPYGAPSRRPKHVSAWNSRERQITAASGRAWVWGTLVLSLRNQRGAWSLFISLTAIPRLWRGPPRGRPDRPARGRACRAAAMQRGDSGRRVRDARWRWRLAPSPRLPGLPERLARQGQAAAAPYGAPPRRPKHVSAWNSRERYKTGLRQSLSLGHPRSESP